MSGHGAKYESSLLSISKVPIHLKVSNFDDSDDMDMAEKFTNYNEKQKYDEISQPNEELAKSNITIHVCDEAKNVKQDFSCPRDLLVKEMKYFSEYFSSDAEKWEDVDISVHCDVLIFDWLMKYIKQNLPPDNEESEREKPQLEPSNVISILISSDFLKMNQLVEECITFCHRNMSAIIAVPCNMNCINDKLVTRISKKFSHVEVEAIKDKKDKFKSKLFCKKLEELFNPSFGNEFSPSNASTLYRCSFCEKLLTTQFHTALECTGASDTTWDVNDHLLYLKNNLKSWRNVYWRIWGSINYLYCLRCDQIFPCSDFGNCSFHSQPAVFDDNSAQPSNTGHYPCCNALAIKFNPLNVAKGCSFRDHLVEVPDPGYKRKSDIDSNDKILINKQKVLDQVMAQRDAICVPANQAKCRSEDNYVTSILSSASMAPPHITTSNVSNGKNIDGKPISQIGTEYKSSFGRRRRTKHAPKDYEDEDQSDPEEHAIVRVVINQARRNRKNAEEKSSSTWDVNLPTRLNQDLQREEDLKRMNELVMTLAKSRIDEACKTELEKNPDNASETSASAGIYFKIEQQLRASLASTKSQGSTSSSATGSRQGRFSTKPG